MIDSERPPDHSTRVGPANSLDLHVSVQKQRASSHACTWLIGWSHYYFLSQVWWLSESYYYCLSINCKCMITIDPPCFCQYTYFTIFLLGLGTLESSIIWNSCSNPLQPVPSRFPDLLPCKLHVWWVFDELSSTGANGTIIEIITAVLWEPQLCNAG